MQYQQTDKAVGNVDKDFIEVICDPTIPLKKTVIILAVNPKTWLKVNKIGVDPERGGNVRKTSDNFFKNNKKEFDVIFIDGLHIYEQCRKDVINSLKVL